MRSLLTIISLILAFVSPAFAGIDWGFDSGAASVNGSAGGGLATISPGDFNTGYHSGTTVPWNLGNVPGAAGFWDLGQSGSIVLSGLSASGPVTINVFQWVDSGDNHGPYSGDLTFTTTSGASGAFNPVIAIASSGLTGAWWNYAANLTLKPADTITITAGTAGAIIGHLTIVPEPGTMIAGAVLMAPFVIGAVPKLLRKRKK